MRNGLRGGRNRLNCISKFVCLSEIKRIPSFFVSNDQLIMLKFAKFGIPIWRMGLIDDMAIIGRSASFTFCFDPLTNSIGRFIIIRSQLNEARGDSFDSGGRQQPSTSEPIANDNEVSSSIGAEGAQFEQKGKACLQGQKMGVELARLYTHLTTLLSSRTL